MPRKPEWLQQLPAALDALLRFPAPVVDRAALEKLLRVERRTAIRLLHRFGGFQAGKTFLVDRVELIAALEKVAAGDQASEERERHTRLADSLDRARLLAPGRKVRIEAASDVRHRVLKELPAGIHLAPGRLTIDFFGAEDLLRHLFELSQAMANDFESFEAAVGEMRPVSAKYSPIQH